MNPKKMNPIEKLLKESIANQVVPYGYDVNRVIGTDRGLLNFLKSTYTGLSTGKSRMIRDVLKLDGVWHNKNSNIEELTPLRWKAREDLFRIGLGLPQKYDSMKISDYKPTRGNVGKDEVFYDFKDKSVDLKGVLGNYKASSPKDSSYQSYYDVWDLEMPAVRGNRTEGWSNKEYIKQGAVQSVIDMLFTPPKIYGRNYVK